MAELTCTAIDLRRDAAYVFRGIMGKDRSGADRWSIPPCRVTLVGLATDQRTGRESVVYRCGGRLRTCGLLFWADHFAPEAVVEEAVATGAGISAPVPEKVAGYKSTSLGM